MGNAASNSLLTPWTKRSFELLPWTAPTRFFPHQPSPTIAAFIIGSTERVVEHDYHGEHVLAVPARVLELVHQRPHQPQAAPTGWRLLEGRCRVRGRRGERIERHAVVFDDDADPVRMFAQNYGYLVVPVVAIGVADDVGKHFVQRQVEVVRDLVRKAAFDCERAQPLARPRELGQAVLKYPAFAGNPAGRGGCRLAAPPSLPPLHLLTTPPAAPHRS